MREDNAAVRIRCTASQCKVCGSVMAAHASMAAATLALEPFIALLRSANGLDLPMPECKHSVAVKSRSLFSYS